MNFESVNPLNIQLNMLSGNLLPITDRKSFSLFWKLYSVLVWIIQFIILICLILGCIYVSTEKVLKDGLICFVIGGEILMVVRIHAYSDLVHQLIRQINDILCTADESMRNIVIETLKPVKIPLKFYGVAGVAAIIAWCSMPFILIFEKNVFWYEDYRIPTAFSNQPFSFRTFVLGNLLVLIVCITMFLKKAGMDVYMIHLVLMTTAQYRYIAMKIAMIFHEEEEHSDINSTQNIYLSEVNHKKKKEIIALCRHHNAIIQ